MAWVLARTEHIHVGVGIINITPPVNHPARVAERVAMMDLVSNGRFEFGTGRGSSTTEMGGFGITDPEITRDMYDEAIREIVRMWRDEPYSYDGKFFSMPERNVLPKPYVKPHPPLWVAAGNPRRSRRPRRWASACICFTGGTPEKMAPLDRDVQEAHRERGTGRRVRQRQHRDHDELHVPRGPRRGAQLHGALGQRSPADARVPLPRHVPEAAVRARVARRRSPTRRSSRSRRASRAARAIVGHARRLRARASRSGSTSASTS